LLQLTDGYATLDPESCGSQQQGDDPAEIFIRYVQQSGSPLHHRDLALLSFQIHHAHATEIVLASDLAQLADALNDVSDPPQRLSNVFQSLAERFWRNSGIGQQELDIGKGRHERIVDFVVQRDGHFPDGRKTLGPHQILLGGRECLLQLASPADSFENLRQELRESSVLCEIVIGSTAECRGNQ